MTGRRLYDHFTDAHCSSVGTRWVDGRWKAKEEKPAWPYLTTGERKMWSDLARRITPRKRK